MGDFAHSPYNMDSDFLELAKLERKAKEKATAIRQAVAERKDTDCYECGGGETYGKLLDLTFGFHIAGGHFRVKWHRDCAIKGGVIQPLTDNELAAID